MIDTCKGSAASLIIILQSNIKDISFPSKAKLFPLAILRIYALLFSRYVDVIEQAVVAGDTVLIENLEETIDPVIDPLLGRHTIKKGR